MKAFFSFMIRWVIPVLGLIALIDPPRPEAQVAVRDFSESEAALAASSERVATFDDLSLAAALFRGETWDAQCRRIVDALPQEVYVSFDIDALTFENCPHTGTPVSGGLTFNQAV